MNDMSSPKPSSRVVIGATSLDPLAQISDMVMGQTLTLDRMFFELAGYAADKLPDYPLNGERFTRLALRAQSNCATALIAMTKARRAIQQGQTGQGRDAAG